MSILPKPPIVPKSDWDSSRASLLAAEKALTAQRDVVSSQRRRLPMFRLPTQDYTFSSTKDASITLSSLFGPYNQLVIHSFMFSPSWDEGCPSCSNLADNLPPTVFLKEKAIAYARISLAPPEKLEAYQKRMGWNCVKWLSSQGTSFNKDFGATVNGGEVPLVTVLFKDEHGVIYQTYQTTGRGVENLSGLVGYLDLVPYGRQETWEKSPEGWPQKDAYTDMRRHDEF